jgi:hypothetical protein
MLFYLYVMNRKTSKTFKYSAFEVFNLYYLNLFVAFGDISIDLVSFHHSLVTS